MLTLSNFKEIKSKEDLPDYNIPVLAYFPRLSASGLPFDITVRIKGSHGDRWNRLTDLDNRGYLSHYCEASHWIYFQDIVEIPNGVEFKKVKKDTSRYSCGNLGFEAPTTADPMGFHDGY